LELGLVEVCISDGRVGGVMVSRISSNDKSEIATRSITAPLESIDKTERTGGVVLIVLVHDEG
jgi:hypothetical protein